MSQKVYIGEDEPASEDYDWLISEKVTNLIHVETVGEFNAKIRGGFYDRTTFDRVKFDYFMRASDTLDFMAKAKPSHRSFFQGKYFMDLPVSILMGRLDGSQDDQLKEDAKAGMTLRDYAQPRSHIHLQNFKFTRHSMTFYDADNEDGYFVTELARGDVNGHGNEDALVLVAGHTQGTMGWSGTCIVTKTDAKERLRIVK